MKPLAECRLYTFVDAAYLHDRDPTDVARELCQGGSDLIQWRWKDTRPTYEHRKLPGEYLADRIRGVTNQYCVGLVINDWPAIAESVGAEFCHLGQEDYFERKISPGKIPFGLSTHSPTQAMRSVAERPAYLAVGPVYATGTKPTAKPVGLEYVRWAAAHIKIPWFAIGGITLNNIDEVLAAGARRICVVSAILNAPDIGEACKAFKKRLASALLES